VGNIALLIQSIVLGVHSGRITAFGAKDGNTK
jgi:hypothetical protein